MTRSDGRRYRPRFNNLSASRFRRSGAWTTGVMQDANAEEGGERMFGRLKRAIRGASQDVKLVRTFLNWRAFRVAERRRDDGETILETRTGLRMAIRHNKWDAKIMREQFLDRYYLTGFRGPIGRPPVVVDVGSY